MKHSTTTATTHSSSFSNPRACITQQLLLLIRLVMNFLSNWRVYMLTVFIARLHLADAEIKTASRSVRLSTLHGQRLYNSTSTPAIKSWTCLFVACHQSNLDRKSVRFWVGLFHPPPRLNGCLFIIRASRYRYTWWECSCALWQNFSPGDFLTFWVIF